MTTVQIELPDDLAKKAQDLGVLSNANIQEIIEAAVRREVGRKLLEVTPLSADYPLKDDGTPMNEDELMDMINEEVRIVRAENRAKRLAAQDTLTNDNPNHS
jgi:predicted transcriptional regulator